MNNIFKPPKKGKYNSNGDIRRIYMVFVKNNVTNLYYLRRIKIFNLHESQIQPYDNDKTIEYFPLQLMEELTEFKYNDQNKFIFKDLSTEIFNEMMKLK